MFDCLLENQWCIFLSPTKAQLFINLSLKHVYNEFNLTTVLGVGGGKKFLIIIFYLIFLYTSAFICSMLITEGQLKVFCSTHGSIKDIPSFNVHPCDADSS